MSENPVRLDFGYCTEEGLKGSGGLTPQDLAAWQEQVAVVHARLQKERAEGRLGFCELPFLAADGLTPILQEAERLRQFCDTLVVLGIGGSALGATAVDMALSGALRHAFARPQGLKRLLVADNPDPRSFAQLLRGVDLATTAFNVVSKSGSTAETMSQFLIVKQILAAALGRVEANRRLVFTTDPEKGNLRLLAKREPVACLTVPPNVGGRYSVLSAVGLLPLAFAGHDVATLLKGAADMAGRCQREGLRDNPAYLFAVLATHFLRAGRNILVMMPYATDLFGLAQWFAQLWAESLGKARSLSGQTVNAGQTPVAAVGATDQHSQLQLYMEGPQDKLVFFLTVDDYGDDLLIPRLYDDIDALAYLGGRTMAELIKAEARATAAALASQGRPSFCLRLAKINANALGQILFLLEAATVAAGQLWQVDPLDQPGVEMGKVLTYGLMGRKGYEEQKSKMQALDISGRYLV